MLYTTSLYISSIHPSIYPRPALARVEAAGANIFISSIYPQQLLAGKARRYR